MNHRTSRLGAIALALGASALAACGGAEHAPEAPPTPSATPDDPAAALDRAEAEITRLLGPAYRHTEAPAQPGAVSPAAPPPPPVGRGDMPAAPKAETRAGEAENRGGPAASSDPCHVACSALASMERAADHLCGLAGASDARCEGARTRVKNATARVKASCPSCAR